MDKPSLRRALIAQRQAIAAHDSRRVALHAVLLQWLHGATQCERTPNVIGAYWPIKGEFDPLPALLEWQSQAPSQRHIALPVVDTQRRSLRFHAWTPQAALQDNAWGIPEPLPSSAPALTPNVLLIACVGYGIHATGVYRLGYGGGFYDRTVPTLEPRPLSVGLAFAANLIPHFSPQPHDVPLQLIVTEHGHWPRGSS